MSKTILKSDRFILALSLLWAVGSVFVFVSCGEEEEEAEVHLEGGKAITKEVDGYKISFSTMPADIHVAASKPAEVDMIFEVSDKSGKHMMGMKPHVHIKSADGKINEEMEVASKGERYTHHHVFKQAGKYHVEFEFHMGEKEHMAEFELMVEEPH